ncbi:MAG TPA: PLP-dependent aminotransferase family protein [Pseudomonadales bacterium]|nr:PLP-dependent aminotransferase family protein [Pseudomonadales bacterium]
MHHSPRFSTRMQDLQASPIREILSIASQPGMVSFAGGLPSPDSFPMLDVSPPADVLQYGSTEGDVALRTCIAAELTQRGLTCLPEQVLVLSGSQQGIDLVAKLFIDAGSPIAVESPTYLAALQVFRLFGARFLPFNIQQADSMAWEKERPTFAYAIPTFQNPTGHCYNTIERAALASACDAYQVPLFEDDPYCDLVYADCDRTPVCARLASAPWIYQGSFSKTLAPGLRLGFLAASPAFIPYLTRLKQAADLHSNRLSQWLVLQQLQHPDRAARMKTLRENYQEKRDQFALCLQQHCSDIATWEIPQGGLFFWLTLHQRIDTRQLLPLAIEQGIAFMPGEHFYPDSHAGIGTLRLNFSHASHEDMQYGLQKLAGLLRIAIQHTAAA